MRTGRGTGGKRAGRARLTCSLQRLLPGDEGSGWPLFSFLLELSFPLSGGLRGEGERGALLGSIISTWDRNRLC